MKKRNIFLKLNLQLFGEGGDGGTGAEGASGVSAGASLPASKSVSPLANVQYGKGVQDAAAQIVTDDSTARAERFETLIKGEYKDLYDARVQDTIQKRLKSSKETVDRYNALSPTLEMLGKKYGVDPTNIEALNRAIEEDDSYYEEEAMEKGVSVEQLKSIRKMERENAALKEQMRAQQQKENADRIYAQWMEEAKGVHDSYPNFSFENELKNQDFVKLLRSGIDVKTAFEVIHKDEIIPAAMQYTAKTVEQKLANKIASGGMNRPVENGMSSQSSAIVKSDVSQLSKADRQEIVRRVQRGEKIRF